MIKSNFDDKLGIVKSRGQTMFFYKDFNPRTIHNFSNFSIPNFLKYFRGLLFITILDHSKGLINTIETVP